MTKIGFTSTQTGLSVKQQIFLVNLIQVKHDIEEFHHGDCIGGDAQAHDIFKAGNVPIIIHPPEDPTKRAFKTDGERWHPVKPYLRRNHDIVNATDLLIACPKGSEILRSGTWATVRYALREHKTVWIVMPDGSFN